MTETLIAPTNERCPVDSPGNTIRDQPEGRAVPSASSDRWVADGPAPVVGVIGDDGIVHQRTVTYISGATIRVRR